MFVSYSQLVAEPNRKWLRHDTPSWIRPENEHFFLTLCCQERGVVSLTEPALTVALMESIRRSHERMDWFVHLVVLMPDHLHGIFSFPERITSMNTSVTNWKRLTAREFGIRWQKGFFDHRLRGPNAWDEKAAYIRMNPVRGGLCSKSEIGHTCGRL